LGQWTFERMAFQGRELVLAEPLTVQIYRRGCQWHADNWELGICVSASTIERLLDRVAESFFSLWDKYAIADDALSAEGAAIRNALQRMAGNRHVGQNKQKTF